jgi:hypothetical protein
MSATPPSSIPQQLQRVHSSNGFPSEIMATHAVLVIGAATIVGPARYDSEIDILRSALEKSIHSSTSSNYSSAPSQAISSPIRRLPCEVLVEIFRLSLSPMRRREMHPRYAVWRLSKSELLQLSRVCSHWHTLAIGTPIFWSDIELHLHYLHTEPAKYMQEMMELLQASIERARNAPLTVILRCGYHLSSSPVLQLLAQFSHRMEKISIVGRFSSLHEFAIMESELPLLRSLELDVEGLKSRGSFQSTPQLEEIICWGPVQDACTVPLSRLRKVTSLITRCRGRHLRNTAALVPNDLPPRNNNRRERRYRHLASTSYI